MASEEHTMAHEPIPPYPKNAPGDFYVENDCCITCEAPYHEAPDLMAHDQEGDYPHCYFKRQPETPEEVERAVMACYVSCVRAVRYAGRNPKILKRFRQFGGADSCDVISPDEDKPRPLTMREKLEGMRPLTLREKLERLRRAEDEPHSRPTPRADHPPYDQQFDG
jgi:hypothetical protein